MTRPSDRRDGVELSNVIRTVRNRWRTRHLLRGVIATAVAAAAGWLVLRLGSAGGLESSVAAVVLGLLVYGGVAAVAVAALVRPLLRRVSDRQVALYLEEHEPALQAEILTAVEAVEERDGSGEIDPFLAGLVRSAVQRAREVEDGRRVDRDALRRLSWSTGALAAVALAILAADFLGVRSTLPEVTRPWTAVQAAIPQAVLVSPGDTAVARGAELRLTARLQGFASDRVEVSVRAEGETRWERWPMVPNAPVGEGSDSGGEEAGPGAGASSVERGDPAPDGVEREFVIFRVEEPLEYFVEAEGIRSGIHRVDVVDRPYVSRLELVIHHPAYTARAPEHLEDGGDLAVLPGTRVVVRAHPTVEVPVGRVILDESGATPLRPDADGALTGEFTVERAGVYRVELDDEQGRTHRGTPDHVIDLLENLAPVVSIDDPGRDVQATSVEEVFVEASAQDDHGIAQLEIVYAVNGGEERTVRLLADDAGRLREASGAHTFFLEEYELEPGDLVAYYARARDVGPGADAREESTDLYFIQIMPFDREFRQADQPQMGGMQGEGEGGSEQGQLSRRQRDIVTATFNVERDRDEYDSEELSEAITTIALAQGRLVDEVRGLITQFQTRGVGGDPEMERVAEMLPVALEAMEEALEELEESRTGEALPPEQRALQHLLRAEAAFREVQLAMAGQQQAGGGGGGNPEEDLADFFDLEMDRMRNQYESLERGSREQADRQLDEAQERLRELARRQEQERERARRAAERQGGAAGSGESQRRLAEETEELARELERLGREQSSPEMQQTAQQLREAAESMRRSAASRDERGVGPADEATGALDEARRLLDRSRDQRTQRDAAEAETRARRALERQEGIQETVSQLPDNASISDRRRMAQQVEGQKDELVREMDGLQQDLRRLAREAGDEDPEAARDLEEAANAIRDGRISDRIDYSRALVGSGRPEQARAFEEDITNRIREIAEQVGGARDSLVGSGEDPEREVMERTRDLLRNAESMAERSRQAGESGEEGAEAGERGEAGEQAAAGQGEQAGEGGQAAQGDQSGQGERRLEERGQGGGQGGDQSDRGGEQGDQAGGQTGQQGQQAGRGGEGRGEQANARNAQGGGGGPGGRLDGTGARGVPDAETRRQLQREAAVRAQEAEELGRAAAEAGLDSEDWERVASAFRSLTADAPYGDPAVLDEIQRGMVESLRELDFVVRRELGATGREEALSSGSADVPEGYRERVEEYFRSLARPGN